MPASVLSQREQADNHNAPGEKFIIGWIMIEEKCGFGAGRWAALLLNVICLVCVWSCSSVLHRKPSRSLRGTLDSLWRAFSFCISQVRVALNMQCVGAARLLPLASWVGRAPARRAQAHYFKSDRNGFSSDM